MGIRYEPAIDGLRAVAVLSVIAYHVGAPAGYVGVDVFFVISGYLITKILLGDPGLLTFYARRARRILPAAFLVVSVTLALSFVLLPSAGDVARSAAAAGVFVANVYFQSATGGYWDTSADTMPLLHLWSLSVEEQFYLVWPVLLILAGAIPGKWPFNRRHVRSEVGNFGLKGGDAGLVGRQAGSLAHIPENVGELHFGSHGRTVILLVAVASFALYAYLSWASPEAAFYQTPARAWELAAGGLVAAWGRGPRQQIVVGAWPATGGGGQVVQYARHVLLRVRNHLFRRVVEHGRPDDLIRLSAVASQSADLKVVEGHDAPSRAERSEKSVLRSLKHSEPRARLNGSAILRNLLAFVLQHASHIGLPLVLLACLVPMPVWAAQPIAVLGATMLVAAVHAGKPVPILASRPLVYVGLISYSLYLWHWPLLAIDRATRVGPAPMETKLFLVVTAFVLAVLTYRYVETPFRRMQAKPRRAVAVGMVCAAALSCTAFVMADEKPKTAEVPDTIIAAEVPPAGCHSKLSEPWKSCDGEVIVWGDSMAWAWSPLGDVGNSRDSCPPFVGYPTGEFTVDRRCREFNAQTFAHAKKANRVILAAAWLSYPPEDVERGLTTTLGGLQNVTIIGPTPVMRDVMPRCLSYGVSKCAVPRAEFDKKAEPMRGLLRRLADKHGAAYVDPADYFCNSEWCPALRNGKPLYWDERHISMSAALGYMKASMSRQTATNPPHTHMATPTNP